MDNQLKNNIIDKIKKGELKNRSRYLFWIQKIGLGSIIVTTILLAVLVLSFTLVYLKATGDLSFLSFGLPGLLAFLEHFPFFLLGIFALVVLVVGFIFKKNNIAYKIPFVYLSVILFLLVLFSGTVLAFSSFQQEIEDKVVENYNNSLFRPTMLRSDDYSQRGLSGVVLEKGDDYLLVKNMNGAYHVVPSAKNSDIVEKIKKGSFIVTTGKWREDSFEADRINFKDKGKLDRSQGKIIELYAGGKQIHLDHDKVIEKRSCLQQCHLFKKPPRECLKECFKP